MQARPRSEGGRAIPDAGAASASVRRSHNSLDTSTERGRQELDDRGPRRPRTTPVCWLCSCCFRCCSNSNDTLVCNQKLRVQRLLLGPSQETLHEYTARSGSPSGIDRSACFMTHLPDSPPKPKSTLSPRSAIAVSRRTQVPERTSVGTSVLIESNAVDLHQVSPSESIAVSTARSSIQDDSSVDAEVMTPEATSELELGTELADSSLSPGDSADEGEDSDRESSTEEAEDGIEERNAVDCSSGPLHTDIDTIVELAGGVGPEEDSAHDNSVNPESPTSRLLETSNADSDPDNDSDSEASSSSAASAKEEYAAVLVERQQILADASDRMRLRSELEGYLESLKSMRGEDGEALVEFPKNYNQILALMTEQDIRMEDSSSSTPGDKEKAPSAQQNWARVLIQTGLAKQQAFGNLEDEDGDGGTASGLAAKIALKVAQIRQLDAVLEEKLGKNLYKATPLRTTKKPERNQEPDGLAARAFLTQSPGSVAKAVSSSKAVGCSSRPVGTASSVDSAETSSSKRKDLHFVRRNKEVVANGMRANMTRAEEARLRQLLEPDGESTEDSPNAAGESGDAAVDSSATDQDSNEFTMNAAEKAAIEQLLASKPDLRRQAILAELEDVAMLDDIPEEGECKRPENRKQRLRLHRIDQELRFLEETPSIAIVSDDDYASIDDDTASEADSDCRSEWSFRTVTSAGGSTTSSMCSTRSGIISRQQFRRFVAEQKAVHYSAPTASSDDIRRLLGSMNRLTTPAAALTPPVS